MASQEKRGKPPKPTGYWYGEVDLRHKGGERFRRRFETKREALGYEAYVKATGYEPATVNDAKAAGPTFAEVTEMARGANAEWKRGRDPSGQRCLTWVVSRIGHLPVAGIETTNLDKLVAELSAKPGKANGSTLQPGTINRYLSYASAVLTFARDRKLLASPPVIPWLEEDGHRTAFLDEALQPTIERYMVGQGWLTSALSLRVLVSSGMRWGEFLSVEAKSVTSEWVKLDKTKTDTPRDLWIGTQLCGEYRAMIQQEARPNYNTMRIHLRTALEACGGDIAIGIHNLRHTTATRLNKAGVPTATIQRFLGHKSIKTTEKYLHIEADDIMAAGKKLSPHRGETAETFHNSEVVDFKKSS